MTLHEYIKETVKNRSAKKYSDEEFFTSRQFQKYLSEIINGLAHRGGLKKRISVHVIWSDSSKVAYTDNTNMTINANSTMLNGLDRESRYKGIRGLAFHELFHLLYTNFDVWNSTLEGIKNGTHSFNEEIDKYLADNAHTRVTMMQRYKYLFNCIEDAYIEFRGNASFPGFGKDVIFSRELQKSLGYGFATLKKWEEENDLSPLDTILNLILSYAVLGGLDLKKSHYKDKRVKAIVSVMSLIDDAIGEFNANRRVEIIDEMVIILWDYFKEELDKVDPKKEETKTPTPPGTSSSEMPKSETSEGAKADSEDKGESSDDKTLKPKAEDTPAMESSKTGSKSRAKCDSDDKCDSSEIKTKESESETETKPTVEDTLSKLKKGPYKPVSIVREEICDEVDEKALEDGLKSLEDTISSSKAKDEKITDEEYEKLINEYNDKFGDYDKSIHDGISCKIYRRNNISSLKSLYETQGKRYDKLGKRMASDLRELLSSKQSGGRTSGMYWGTTMDSHKLFVPDGKIFYKDILPEDSTFGTEVCVLVDESGSMRLDSRVEYAKTCAMVLYSICRELEIPVAVYGHSADMAGADVTLYDYADYDRPQDTDKYRIMEIAARNNNRDGYAVKYCCDRLMERTAPKKLFFIISDGTPAAHRYYASNGGAELRRLLNEYTKKGITFIAAGICSDAGSLKAIYGEHFLPIDNLKALPRTLGKLLKRQLHIVE